MDAKPEQDRTHAKTVVHDQLLDGRRREPLARWNHVMIPDAAIHTFS
jgi:hypothetical protein